MYRSHPGLGELFNISLQGSALLGFVYINYGNAWVVICLIQQEDYLQEDCRIKPVSLDIFPHVWIPMRGKVVPICWLPDWHMSAGRPVGDLELWDSCALGLPVSTRKGSGYQPLPSAKYLGLCLSSSRCSDPLDLSLWCSCVLRVLPG